jgi:hypothetical protein
MAFVGPRGGRSDGGEFRWAFTAWSVFAAIVMVAGALGDEFRWLGGVALSEVVVSRGLRRWRPGLLRRPWLRLGLRLATAAVLLRLLHITMPDAAVVGTVFLFAGVASLIWLGMVRLVGMGPRDDLLVATMALAVGLWFSLLPVSGSGWGALTALLAAATALEASRVANGASAAGEEA